MKRISVFVLLIFISITFCSCEKEENVSSRESVTINLPVDNTVNGYKDITSIASSSVCVSSTEDTEKDIQYCANVKSKVFHLTDCSSVRKMKEENKYFLSDRDALIADGFKPCASCKP